MDGIGWSDSIQGEIIVMSRQKTKFTQPSILNGLFEDFKSASLVYISVCYVSKTGDVNIIPCFFVVFNLVVMFHHGNINLRNPELHLPILPRFVPFVLLYPCYHTSHPE